jgi:hypothetical protein
MCECRAEPQLLQFCSSVQDEEGAVDLVMDLPSEDTQSIIVARLEPSDGSSELGLSANPTSLSASPEPPPGLGTLRKSCKFNCYCSCHSDNGEMPRLQIKHNMTVLNQITRIKRRCSDPTCQRTITSGYHTPILTLRKSVSV